MMNEVFVLIGIATVASWFMRILKWAEGEQ